jgi:hypothetical protein
MKCKKPISIIDEKDLLRKSNHLLGCNLECYAQVLRYRGYEKEAEQLDNIASRIK